MMNLPHLTFLRSYEAAARHLSFTTAAEELNCTQSAVSNHVRSLEEFIGRPLFVRHPRSLSLTDVGEAYLPSVRRALLVGAGWFRRTGRVRIAQPVMSPTGSPSPV